MSRRSILTIIVWVFGLLLLFIAFFASALGLDRDTGWGRVRVAALVVGLVITFGAIYSYLFADRLASLLQAPGTFLQHIPAVTRTLRGRGFNKASRLWHAYRFTLPLLVVVIVLYVWFVSAGTWTTWISPTRYYADLARGFERGHLYLPTKVDPHLLALSDPYDPANRGNVEAPLDITFYKGKYYLYWGPVPALVLAVVQFILPGRVGDLFLVFSFVCGIFLSQCFLLIVAWDRFFSTSPKWLLAVSILLAGLAGPTTFMLDHVNSARIYEAAITGGQFFLIAGLVVLLSAPNGFFSGWWLALTGLLWALAIGTRLTLIAPIGVMAIIITYQILRSKNSLFSKVARSISLGLSLALGLACLGWYNWARFGSVTETGYYYQLAGPYLQKYYSILFHPVYFLQNLYNYLLHPFQVNSQFPFIHPTYGRVDALFPTYSLPGIYSAQVITGILFTAPFAVFAFIPLALTVHDHFQRRRLPEPIVEERADELSTTTLLLGTAVLFAFLMLLFFFWAGMRYSEDFMPALMILSAISFWQGYQVLAQHVNWIRLYTIAGVVLASMSILISMLTALSVNNARFVLTRVFGFP